ncbi:hypothetical protein AXG89_41565 (plasmid) [Burkholderia sp. PAMC 26561]|nr:hypothetical protein AXG89_41485 [Burkholderia sp. PAMC 26561]AMH42814.1 hypothetical protein AXG89_41565 [Burkholderia sp. PAMC 26561]
MLARALELDYQIAAALDVAAASALTEIEAKIAGADSRWMVCFRQIKHGRDALTVALPIMTQIRVRSGVAWDENPIASQARIGRPSSLLKTSSRSLISTFESSWLVWLSVVLRIARESQAA